MISFLLYFTPFIIGVWSQLKIFYAYKKWSKIKCNKAYTGSEVANLILKDYNINNIKIKMINGELNDHFNPLLNTIYLSENTYFSSSIASIGIAAHEVGHVLQYKNNYIPLKIRSLIIPITNIITNTLPIILFSGFIFNSMGIIRYGIISYFIITIFHLITLPIEFDASIKAKKSLLKLKIIDNELHLNGIIEVLQSASLTYIAALIASGSNLIYLLNIYNKKKE